MATRTRKHYRADPYATGPLPLPRAIWLTSRKHTSSFRTEICIAALVSRLHPSSFFQTKNRIPDGGRTTNMNARVDTSPKVADEVKTTTCYMCACRCGIKVHLKDGQVRYIKATATIRSTKVCCAPKVRLASCSNTRRHVCRSRCCGLANAVPASSRRSSGRKRSKRRSIGWRRSARRSKEACLLHRDAIRARR